MTKADGHQPGLLREGPVQRAWDSMDAPTPLFQQYESDYCQKSTSVSKKLPTLEGLAGGE